MNDNDHHDNTPLQAEKLLSPSQVARLFAVDPKTVTRWANDGLLGKVIRTPGGVRRYREDVIRELLNGQRS